MSATELKYVSERLAQFNEVVVSLSRSAPPPGPQAGNGWFREYMVSDRRVAECGNPPTLELSDTPDRLFAVYTFYYANAIRAFRDNRNAGASIGQRIGIVFEAMWDEIQGRLGRIFDQLLELDVLAAMNELKEAVRATINRVNSGTVATGEHLNGWIWLYMNDAASWSLNRMQEEFPQAPAEASAADVHRVFNAYLNAIKSIPRRDGPWLPAAWQIEFEAICSAVVIALRSIRFG